MDECGDDLVQSMGELHACIPVLQFGVLGRDRCVAGLMDAGVLRTLLSIITKGKSKLYDRLNEAQIYESMLMYRPILDFLIYCSFVSTEFMAYCAQVPNMRSWLSESPSDMILFESQIILWRIAWVCSASLQPFDAAAPFTELEALVRSIDAKDDSPRSKSACRVEECIIGLNRVLHILRVRADQKVLQKLESALRQYDVPIHKSNLRIMVKKLLLLTIGIAPGSKTD